MEKYVLSNANYRHLKELDLSEMGDNIVYDEKNSSFSTNDVNLLLIIIDETIVSKCMDAAQERCNEYGRALYGLHDEILYQKRSK